MFSTGMLVLLTVAACGREQQASGTTTSVASDTAATGGSAAAQSNASVSAGAAVPATGKTWDVKMIGDASGYRFDPVSLTIKAGDAVRWTVTSGPPHNVTFWPDSIPNGATAQLGANMPRTTATLTGALQTNVNDTYVVSFAGVPTGTYAYYCTPHLTLGMKGKIIVQ